MLVTSAEQIKRHLKRVASGTANQKFACRFPVVYEMENRLVKNTETLTLLKDLCQLVANGSALLIFFSGWCFEIFGVFEF